MAEQKAFISGGHVYCRVAHEDRDIEQCMGCVRLKRVVDVTSPPHIVCDAATPGDPVVGDPLFVEWWHQHHRRAR